MEEISKCGAVADEKSSPTASKTKNSTSVEPPNTIPTAINVGFEHLTDTLEWLTRWELDALLLVSQKFRAAVPNEGSGSLQQQRRMISNFTWEIAPRPDNWYYTISINSTEAAANYMKATILRKISHDPEGDADGDIELSSEDLGKLIEKSPLLRARNTTIGSYEEFAGDESAVKFASLWQGCSILLILVTKPIIYEWRDFLYGCSSLVGNELDADKDPYEFRRIGVLLERAVLKQSRGGGGGGGCSISTLSHFGCLRKIKLWDPCSRVTFEQVVDFLFASARDGQRRELDLSLKFPVEEASNYTSLRLKQLIEQALVGTASQSPKFSLRLEFKDMEPLRGEFNLGGGGETTGQQPDASASFNPKPKCSCIFVASEASTKDWGDDIPDSTPTTAETMISVECD